MSQILTAYRSIGVYTDGNPFSIQRLGTVHFAAFTIEKSYQVYNCEKLHLVGVGPIYPHKLTAICIKDKLTFVATKNMIHINWRNKFKNILEGHTDKITGMLVLGDYLISLSLDETIKVWDYREAVMLNDVLLSNLRYTVMMHPDTYVNKVVLGTQEGVIELWNIRTGKLIYTFEGWGASVTAIVQSPVLDVVAIGLSNGTIVLHNLKLDKTLFTFKQNERVTALAFRTDGRNFLASGDSSGNITLWNLDERSLHSVMRFSHQRAITSMYFYEKEPILITSGQDNAINIWIFDQEDDIGRLLKGRSGHILPPSSVDFYVSSSMVISGGPDRSLRLFSTVKDQRNREFSQGSIKKKSSKKKMREENFKVRPIKSVDALRIRQREWDNIVTCHENSHVARSWSKENYKLGSHKFKSTCPKRTPITAVAISSCGNFTIIGDQSGWLDIYNIQSGIHRGIFADVDGHSKEITGIVTTQDNSTLITSSFDSSLKFWSFRQKVLLHTVDVGYPISKISLNKEGGLLAVVADDFNLRIYDSATRKLVRFFSGHCSNIVDISFSGDGRWIISCDAVSEVRIWDIPSGRCIDYFKMASPVTSVSFSPTSSFIATSHVGSKAISLWVNKSYFTDVFLKPIPKTPSVISLPSSLTIEHDDSDEEMEEEDFWVHLEEKDFLSEELITLSRNPSSKWKILNNLDLIQERNKPIKPPDAPKQAPFILPTIAGVEPQFVSLEETENEAPKSKIISMDMDLQSRFMKLMRNCEKKSDYTPVIKEIIQMPPAAIDFEIRSMNYLNDMDDMKVALRFLKAQLTTKKYFDAAQAFLSVFLKAHMEILASNEETLILCEEVKQIQRENWQKLEEMIDSSLCLLGYFSNTFDQV